MKITGVETIAVRVPLKSGMTTKTAHGEHAVSRYVVVRIRTDRELVGLGEATVEPRWSGETTAGAIGAVRDVLAPALDGQDPTRMPQIRRLMERALKLNPFTRAAVEMALWDLAGKAAGVPVYQLLGGRARDVVPIKMVVGAFDVPKATELARRFLEWGVRCLKVKVGLDPRGDLARVKAIRELAGPEVSIGIDANCGWNVTTAWRTLHEMAPYDLLFAEQPIPPGDPRDLARLRQASTTPIMADESVFTLADAFALCAAGAADILSIYPGKNGGLWQTLEIAHVARAAGIVVHMGSNLELGIATAAMLHAAAAIPNMDSETYPADILGPLYHEADLLRQPLSLGPAVAQVPEGPGLGVALDEGQLDKYREK